MKDIYGMTPINKTASLVTGQSGCSSDQLTDEQLRENLVAQVKKLSNAAMFLPKGSKERKALGVKIHNIQNRINAIRPKRNGIGVDQYFIDVAREQLSKAEFSRWMDIACERMRAQQ